MGYNSLGNIFFYGTGMYVFAVIAIGMFYPFGEWTDASRSVTWKMTDAQYYTGLLLGSLGAGIFCAITAYVVGGLFFGLRGPYFAIGTLGLAIATGEIVSNIDWLGGGQGISMPIFNGDFSQFYIDFSSGPGMLLTTLAILLVGLFFTSAFVKRRFLCSYCPMLALMSLFDKIGFTTLKKDGQRCTRCSNCYRACPMEIRAIEEEKLKTNLVTQDCILCLRCVESCPENRALEATFAGIPIFTASDEGFLKRQEKATGGTAR